MNEDTERDASLSAISAVIRADAYLLNDLGAIAVRSNVHPQWVHIDFPGYATAIGQTLKRIRGAMQALIRAGGEPSVIETPAGGSGVIRSFVEGRIYIHRDVAKVVLAQFSQNKPESNTDGSEEADTGKIEALDLILKTKWRGFLKANITDGRF